MLLLTHYIMRSRFFLLLFFFLALLHECSRAVGGSAAGSMCAPRALCVCVDAVRAVAEVDGPCCLE